MFQIIYLSPTVLLVSDRYFSEQLATLLSVDNLIPKNFLPMKHFLIIDVILAHLEIYRGLCMLIYSLPKNWVNEK